jgi:hypothetical protein
VFVAEIPSALDQTRLRAAVEAVEEVRRLPARHVDRLVELLLPGLGHARAQVRRSRVRPKVRQAGSRTRAGRLRGGPPWKAWLVALLSDTGEALKAVGLRDTNWSEVDGSGRECCKHRLIRAIGPLIPARIPRDLKKLDRQARAVQRG